MTYRGHVHNGVIVLDSPHELPEGAAVHVEPLPEPAGEGEPRRGSSAAILKALREAGPWEGPPGELDRLLKLVQADRDEDLRMELERERRRGMAGE